MLYLTYPSSDSASLLFKKPAKCKICALINIKFGFSEHYHYLQLTWRLAVQNMVCSTSFVNAQNFNSTFFLTSICSKKMYL